MDENIKVCSKCGEKNEKIYSFCKNCGNSLVGDDIMRSELVENKQNGTFGENGTFVQGQQYGGTGNTGWSYSTPFDSIDGIPSDEIALFVGKKSNNVLKKFTSMQISNSHVSWCWPAAVLGFLFGPVGAAIWFFYRKMYKYALILAAVGAVIIIGLDILQTGDTDYSKLVNIDENGKIELFLGEITENTEEWRNVLGSSIESFVNILTTVLAGIFAFDFYKKHTVNKIREYRSQNSDPRYYRIGLSMLGGTSGGMACLGILVLLAAHGLGSSIGSVISLII